MASNFDTNFEQHKATFKQKFGIDWNKDYNLYLSYLQTLHLSAIAEIENSGLNTLLRRQEEIIQLLQGINKNFTK